MSVEKEKLNFIPSESEKTADLKELLANVDILIANYNQLHPEEDLKQVKRFVAGSVCFEDLEDFHEHFKMPMKKRKKSVWNKFASEEAKKGRSFSDMPQIADQYRQLKSSNPEKIEALKAECLKDAEKSKEDDSGLYHQVRVQKYREAERNMYLLSVDMLRNFGTHVAIFYATDSTNYTFYQPSNIFNSEIAKRAAEELREKITIPFEIHLDYCVLTHGENKRRAYKEAPTALTAPTAPTVPTAATAPAAPTAATAPATPASVSRFQATARNKLREMIREAALASWNLVAGSEEGHIPWKMIHDADNNNYRVEGWPTDIGSGLKDGKFDLEHYKKKDMVKIMEAFTENQISFHFSS